ncbi:MAG: hypothetical protein ACI9F9_001072 [Candidatus Paceibacteria bacterium]|jgi:hypothetical protein
MLLLNSLLGLGLGSLAPAPAVLVLPDYTTYNAAPLMAPAQPGLLGGDFEFSYTFLELGFYSTDVDLANETSDAYHGRASLGLLWLLYIYLDYAEESVEFMGADVDTDTLELGLGGHFGLGSRFDLVGEVGFLSDDSSSSLSQADGSETGYNAYLGGRWLALPTSTGGLELNGGYRYVDLESPLADDSLGAWEVGARFHFLSLFSIGADYSLREDDSRVGFNARVSF